MSIALAVLSAVGICILSAIFEGVMAGGNVKQYFAKLHQPRYAISLKGWFAIGGLYYVVFGIVVYRLLRYDADADATVRNLAFILLILMMVWNAVWNYIFFRARNLFISLVAFVPYIMVTLALIAALSRFDQIAAGLVFIYSLYLVYATSWAYKLWNLNRTSN
jgi:tryptophan-rich sensory protein